MSDLFAQFLEDASFRFVPFKVVTAMSSTGRKLAPHDIPFANGITHEDLGRRGRLYRLQGYVLGPNAALNEKALQIAAELPGAGLLVHPTLGAKQVVCANLSTSVSRERLGAVMLEWEFIEDTPTSLIGLVLTGDAFGNLAGDLIGSVGSELASYLSPLATGSFIVAEAGFVLALGLIPMIAALVNDGSGPSSAVVGLPGDNGRYGQGASAEVWPDGTTVSDAIVAMVEARQNVDVQSATMTATVSDIASPATDLFTTIYDTVDAVRVVFRDPADQVRVTLDMCGFVYPSDGAAGNAGLVRNATANAVRWSAAFSLAAATAVYQPRSYDDAIATMMAASSAIETIATEAADDGFDRVYQALRSLAGAVVEDLTRRGASLAPLVDVKRNEALPALALAYQLYSDTARADELIGQANPVHPAFMPTAFRALAF